MRKSKEWKLCRFIRFWYGYENEYNRSGFQIDFFNISVWDRMTADFGIEFEIGVSGSTLYLRFPFFQIVVYLLPNFDPDQKTWRTK